MLRNFKTYQLSVQFYRECSALKMPMHLKDQLLRSSSSVALNIAEGSGKTTPAEKRRFYSIALGSLRESQAALELSNRTSTQLEDLTDQLGACLYRLCHPK